MTMPLLPPVHQVLLKLVLGRLVLYRKLHSKIGEAIAMMIAGGQTYITDHAPFAEGKGVKQIPGLFCLFFTASFGKILHFQTTEAWL